MTLNVLFFSSDNLLGMMELSCSWGFFFCTLGPSGISVPRYGTVANERFSGCPFRFRGEPYILQKSDQTTFFKWLGHYHGRCMGVYNCASPAKSAYKSAVYVHSCAETPRAPERKIVGPVCILHSRVTAFIHRRRSSG